MVSTKYQTRLESSSVTGPMVFDVNTDGEVIYACRVNYGQSHRGIEKICEKTQWASALPLIERTDYLSANSAALAYCMAVEKLSEIEVPEKGRLVRIVLAELSRVSSHFYNVGMMCSAVGASTAVQFALRDRERVADLFEMLAGARLLLGYLRIGGIALDVSDGFIEKTYEFIDYIVPKLAEYRALTFENKVFSDRLSQIGAVDPALAISYGVTGPALRSAGAAIDIRKQQPYSDYHRLTFDFLIENLDKGSSDALDRFDYRLKEIEHSCSLIKLALDLLDQGDFLNPISRHFKPREGKSYASVEGPRGVFSVYVESRGERTPYRVKIVPPSLSSVALISKIAERTRSADLSVLVSSFDVLASEVDR